MDKLAKETELVAELGGRVPQELKVLYAPIRAQLEKVETTLRSELRSDHAFVDRLARHGLRLGGKRLRPALVLFSAGISGKTTAEHLILAAAVELIHTATLIHDDVLDEATLRRHLDTVNARWDNETSVLLGDYLLARAIRMVAALDDPLACRVIGEAAQTMCEGELLQINSRGNFDLSEQDYLDIIAAKTAGLTACCCQLGSHYAGADAAVCQKLTRFGQYLGMAFQIVDDLLDVLGDEATTGKSLGTDLAKQKPTLPLIRLLGGAKASDRSTLVALLSRSGNHHREALRPWFDRSDAIAYSRDKSLEYSRRAGKELDGLPAGAVRDALSALTDFVVTRTQ